VEYYVLCMSHSELIEFVDRSSLEDRLFLHAYLEHVARSSDPEYGRDLDRRLEAMRSGDEVSLEDARRLHEALASQGL
jgi:hypothetical protein